MTCDIGLLLGLDVCIYYNVYIYIYIYIYTMRIGPIIMFILYTNVYIGLMYIEK